MLVPDKGWNLIIFIIIVLNKLIEYTLESVYVMQMPYWNFEYA